MHVRDLPRDREREGKNRNRTTTHHEPPRTHPIHPRIPRRSARQPPLPNLPRDTLNIEFKHLGRNPRARILSGGSAGGGRRLGDRVLASGGGGEGDEGSLTRSGPDGRGGKTSEEHGRLCGGFGETLDVSPCEYVKGGWWCW